MMKITRRGVLAGGAMLLGFFLPTAQAQTENIKWDESYQVVVAGGGVAGCMAAIEAAKKGAKVLLVHAAGMLGGNSAISSGWIRSANTRWHQKKGIKDTADDYYENIVSYGRGTRNEQKARVIAEESKNFVNYLMDIGVKFTDEEDRANGGPTLRVVKAAGGGSALMKRLSTVVKKTPGITVLTKTHLLDVVLDDNKEKVIGVVILKRGMKKEYIKTPAVVIATGGFGRNQDLIEKYTSQWAHTGRVMDSEDKGTGLEIATNLGAGVANLDVAMVCPTLEVTKNIFYSSAPLINGGIIVNEKGRRFTNEYVIYTQTPIDMLKQEKTYEILTEGIHPVLEKMIEAQVVKKCKNYEELAKVIGCPVEGLKADIEEHNAITRQKPEDRKDRFGRVVYGKELKPPFYVLQIKPVMIETVGGITINEKGEITSLMGKPVATGLYGAGAVAFGEHFGVGYRSGEAYVYSGVTGMVAGQQAATLALAK